MARVEVWQTINTKTQKIRVDNLTELSLSFVCFLTTMWHNKKSHCSIFGFLMKKKTVFQNMGLNLPGVLLTDTWVLSSCPGWQFAHSRQRVPRGTRSGRSFHPERLTQKHLVKITLNGWLRLGGYDKSTNIQLKWH